MKEPAIRELIKDSAKITKKGGHRRSKRQITKNRAEKPKDGGRGKWIKRRRIKGTG